MNTLSPLFRDGASSASRGGRRQVTIAFVDLVGSTALSHQLDPEDFEDLLSRYHRLCEDRVVRFGGHVEQFQGDGVLCCFGYPAAHEDDAARAVRAALEIAQDVSSLSYPGRRQPLQARVGVATGLTVIDAAAQARSFGLKVAVGGETPSVAARVQSIALAGSVAITEGTRRIVEGAFELAGMGRHTLKGLSEPQTLWRVIRARNLNSRFEARSPNPARVVGREAEMAALVDAWQRAISGSREVVLLAGEPGIGKSRLVRELANQLRIWPGKLVLYQCSPDHENTAFWPLLKHLDDRIGDGVERTYHRLGAVLTAAGIADDDACPLLAPLLAIEIPPDDATQSYSPEKRRDRTAEVLARLAVAGNRAGTPVIVFEDMHWADPSTVELAGRIAHQIGSTGGLFIATHRPEFDATQLDRPGVTRMALGSLDVGATTALIRDLTSGRSLPEQILDGIIARTDGVPLFVEELTRSVVESGLLREVGNAYEISDDVGTMAIPTTLKDSLMARLDRLGSEREIAQMGAAIGREFSRELLVLVAPVKGEQLDSALDRLVASGLISMSGPNGRATFAFRHALIQDAAYESLLKSTRQELHGNLATAIVQHWPETQETDPEVLALHLTRAGRADEAAPLWLRAGQRALGRLALIEAIAHFSTALSIVAGLPRDREVEELELAIRVGLGAAYIAQRGWASEKVRLAAGPARALAAGSRNISHLVTTHFQVWVNFHTRCDFTQALEVADDLIERGRQLSDQPALLAHGYGMAAQTLYFVGRLEDSLKRMALCRQFADFERDQQIVVNTNHEVTSSSEARVGTAHWILGHPDRAIASARRTVACARRAGHAFNLAFVLAINAHSWFSIGDMETAAAQIDEALRTAANQRLVSLQRMTLPLYEGRKLLHMGRFREGLKAAAPALDELRRTGQLTTVSSNLVMLGRLLAGAGESRAGLAQIEAGIALTDETGELFELPELWRLKGLTFEELDRPEDAEECYRRAIAIAQQLGGRSWELRAATSLAELLCANGSSSAVEPILRQVHDSFTDGQATADVRRAGALLDRLASAN